MNRRLSLSVSCLLVLALLVSVPGAWATKPKVEAEAAAVQEILPDEKEASVVRGDKRVSLETGAPLALYRVGYRVASASPRDMAAQYLRENVGILALEAADLSDLEHRMTWASPAGHTVRFRQTVDAGGGRKIPVYDAEVAVTVNRRSTVTFVMNGYKPGVRITSAVPAISGDKARASALSYLGAGELAHETSRLVVYHRRGVSRLAWELRVVPADFPIGDWEVLVDAHSGEIFKVADRAFYVDGNGNVFDPDPLSSAGASYGDPGFVDGNDADTTQLTGQLQNLVLRDLTLNGGTYSLVGPWAEIVDTENPSNGLFSQASSTFNFTREQDGFEAVHTYFHVDNIMRWINVDLGLSITPYQYSGGARFDPHGLNGSDNSHYTSSNGVVAFGEGGVDDAEDADVVIHELGHALHDWVTGGSLSQVEGLSEGSGDYIAASYSRSLGQWTPADPQYNWVFDWDGHNPFWGGRITNYGASYPGGLTGSIHTDGQIWSTCNMQVWDAIGRIKTDQAFWAGLGMTNSGTNQQDAAQAVLDAAVNMGYSGADVSTMESIYQGCGYNVTAQCTATCSNNVIECDEVCDGTDLGGASCAGEGCSGGTLACNGTCDGFDTSACTGCAQCDNDGTCELGEDCNGCPNDCVSGTTSGAVCGNGICEAGDGENCVTCSSDCNGRQKGKPANRFCCGDGGGTNPLPCSDPACSTGGWSCTDVPTVPGSFCCGDLTCDSGESCSTCALDCSTGGELCTGGIDEDCNGAVDCADAACTGDPACQGCQLGGPGDACSQNSDCCSGRCKGNGTCK
jgi:hypothetical protein